VAQRRRLAQRADSRGQRFRRWLDWLVDEGASQETVLAEHDELENRRKALSQALDVLNERERRIFEELCLAEGQTSSASTTCTRSE
jgi:DNA-directed RNA polymerase sigma subunit (sigma70/sigma32)